MALMGFGKMIMIMPYEKELIVEKKFTIDEDIQLIVESSGNYKEKVQLELQLLTYLPNFSIVS